jgi:radical SAM protein with 4Fe4S-binding SPASM domain
MRLEQIRFVEIELFNYCNRKCKWCPNSLIDRQSDYQELPEEIFLNLIEELADINYSKFISFSRYNEPLSNPELLNRRIAQIRPILPDATLVTNTNGDYGWDADVDELTVMDYENILEHRVFEQDGKKVRIMGFEGFHFYNRGGLLENMPNDFRKSPCLEPCRFVGIDYTGDVVPCSNIRSDAPEHKEYVLGNLHNDSLLNILNYETSCLFRQAAEEAQFMPPCIRCNKGVDLEGAGRHTRDDPGIEK